MGSYKDLNVWKKSIVLTQRIYSVTDNFPSAEMYGLTSQLRRSSVAIPSNIAEGQKRGHRQEFIQFLRIAYASGAEIETQLIIAQKLGFLSEEDYKEVNLELEVIMKMLNAMIQSLQKTSNESSTKNYKL